MYSPKQTIHARELRQRANGPERRAWFAIRQYAKGRVSIRRQHPVGRFYLDFYCPLARLGLELDGESHHGNEDYDHWRTVELEKLGIEIVRAPNEMTDAFNLDPLAEWFVELCVERIAELRDKG